MPCPGQFYSKRPAFWQALYSPPPAVFYTNRSLVKQPLDTPLPTLPVACIPVNDTVWPLLMACTPLRVGLNRYPLIR